MSDSHFFENCYRSAVAAALPDDALEAYLPSPPKGRLIVVGAGKGAAQLAQAFERAYLHPIEGVVVTRYGFGVPCSRIKVLEAAHPVPDANSQIGAQALLDAVSNLSADDLVVALITGGGSALLAAPLEPMTLADEIAMNEALLRSGAPIGAMNILRRHVSAIKGGRLAAAADPARILTYIISDVPGDDPAQVASGPTVGASTTPVDARRVIADYGLELPTAIGKALSTKAALCPAVASEVYILASAAKSLAAVQAYASARGIETINLGDAIEGEARAVAIEHAAFVRMKLSEGWRGLILSGGETTVTLEGSAGGGKGGRNTQYLLSLAIELSGVAGVSMFAADTDGVDGSEDNAGAFADGQTVARIAAAGIAAARMGAEGVTAEGVTAEGVTAEGASARDFLERNDAYSAFASIGALFAPGPSGTNVNDLRLILLKGISTFED